LLDSLLQERMSGTEASFLTSLMAGGMAGTAVDVFLFPLDTVKTRLQSPQGFLAAGGFRRIYAGIGPAALGSAPNAALFFCTYDTIKRQATNKFGLADSAGLHMGAASAGEVAACLIRVPTEIVKQRRQAGQASGLAIVRATLQSEGVLGLYRGYFTTLAREIPFSLIQFPLWEFLKKRVAHASGQETAQPWQASLCGAFAGGFSAAATTPLDVAKTRIMLAQAGSKEATLGTLGVIRLVFAERGVGGLFAGVTPRVTWISIGGAVFFGVYEKAKSVLS